MGFDLLGRYPVSEEGSYFRMNQFMWPPFIDLLHDISARDILRKCRLWYSSDEDGLDEKHALALAKDLQNRIDDGTVEKALERRRYGFASYQSRAKRRGGRHARDARGNLAAIESARAEAQRKARPSGNVTESSDIPITREDAERFVTFLKDCGGYRIC
jgi:hypothetical protein